MAQKRIQNIQSIYWGEIDNIWIVGLLTATPLISI